MQLMTAVSPQLEQLKKEVKLVVANSQYTRYGTVILALFKLSACRWLGRAGCCVHGDFGFHFVAVSKFVAGAMSS